MGEGQLADLFQPIADALRADSHDGVISFESVYLSGMKTLKETFGFIWTGSGLSLAEGAAPQSKTTMINSIFDNFLFYSPAHSGTADITVPSLW